MIELHARLFIFTFDVLYIPLTTCNFNNFKFAYFAYQNGNDRNPKQFQNRALYMAFTRKINNQSNAADATLINSEMQHIWTRWRELSPTLVKTAEEQESIQRYCSRNCWWMLMSKLIIVGDNVCNKDGRLQKSLPYLFYYTKYFFKYLIISPELYFNLKIEMAEDSVPNFVQIGWGTRTFI